MHLYWVVNAESDHYQRNLCRSWGDAFENFHFTSVIAGGEANQAILVGAERIVADFPDLVNVDVYANGPEAVMHEARALLLTHGLPADRLFVDQLERY
jgi:CDP-4-dehydro-6-deoxyglucose reductase